MTLSSIKKNTNIFVYSKINDPNYSKENIFTNVTNMRDMFNRCSSLISLPDISKWNTDNVKNMSQMFDHCSSLISLPDISKWNTKNVTNMFKGCHNLLNSHH